MNEIFRSKCKSFSERLNILNSLLEDLKQRIIMQDLSAALGTQVKVGIQPYSSLGWLEETVVGGESFNLNNKSKQKYFGYVVYTKKGYHTVGLGFLYKDEIVAPHMDFCVDRIITKYSDAELDEITKLMDEAMIEINQDIDYLKANFDVHVHEHYYGEYNSGFESHNKYETISDVIDDYKKM